MLRPRKGLFDHIVQILAEEASDMSKGIAKTKLLDDVVADDLRGAGGEGGDGLIGEKFAKAAELAVVRAKVVAPFGDAVGFVNREEGDGDALEPFGGAIEDDAFGRKVEKAIFAGGDAAL